MFTASAHKIWTVRLQYSVLLAILVFLLGVIPTSAATIDGRAAPERLPDAITAPNTNTATGGCQNGSV